jgi:hypothetical protein
MTTETEEKKVRQMPKGGRKGGSVFPRVSLIDAVGYARKLVSKTHTGPQPEDVILSGVFGSRGGRGNVRMSALKQYGFLKGDRKTNFSADDLAKKIAAAPLDELVSLYRKAILKPMVFKKLFETFHGDTVSKAKLKQRAAELKVHPDETSTCVDLYVAGMTSAELVTVDGDHVSHLASNYAMATTASAVDDAELESIDEKPQVDEQEEAKENGGKDAGVAASGANDDGKVTGTDQSGPRAVFNVSVTLDSSLDIEKLQKQLELLKRFGAI